jgi:hypothetical protein
MPITDKKTKKLPRTLKYKFSNHVENQGGMHSAIKYLYSYTKPIITIQHRAHPTT